MLISGQNRRTIRPTDDGAVEIIDQRRLPHAVETVLMCGLEDAVRAIADMQVRGAPLIGVTAAWGLALALAEDPSDQGLAMAGKRLAAARPAAGERAWALERAGAGGVGP